MTACTSTVTGQGPSSSSSGSTSGDGTMTSAGGTSTEEGSSGSNGSSEYDAMFGPPESSEVTGGSIGGLWAGQTYYNDLRVRIGASSITVAMKCRTGTIGTKIAAQVSSSSIRILESQQIGAEYSDCTITVRPQTLDSCNNTANGYECFSVSGTTLTFNGVRLFGSGSASHDDTFTKLSD